MRAFIVFLTSPKSLFLFFYGISSAVRHPLKIVLLYGIVTSLIEYVPHKDFVLTLTIIPDPVVKNIHTFSLKLGEIESAMWPL